MTQSTYSNDRRFRNRYTDPSILAEVSKRGWLGHPKAIQVVKVENFSLSGIAISATFKLKLNQQLILNLEHEDHRLNAIPAVVSRIDRHDVSTNTYYYALKYTFGALNEPARNVAYTVLKLIEERLIATADVA